jgi:polar amino acid transport system permease protein
VLSDDLPETALVYHFDFPGLLPYWRQFLEGIRLTAELTLGSIAAGSVLGVLLAVARREGGRVLRGVCGAYVELLRNTPFIVQIFMLYFGLSSVGLQLSAALAGVLALAFNVAAYSAEIFRAGMDSIEAGQWEAAECLGLSKARIYWHVVLPPALERVYPALTSQFVLMMLMTSVVSQISADDLTAIANNVQSMTFLSFETYIVVALIYVAMALALKTGCWAIGLILFPRRRALGGASFRELVLRPVEA